MGWRAQALAGAVGVGAGALPIPGGVPGIPDRALVAYVQAAATAPCRIDWASLAAIGAVETGHGTHGGAHLDSDGKMTDMAVSWAGAEGPLQFIPSTWQAYGAGDVNDVDDASVAAAKLLCADGFERDPLAAVKAYNCGCVDNGNLPAETRNYVVEWQRFVDAYRRAGPATANPAQGKERSIGRLGSSLWNATMRGWVRVGELCGLVPKCEPVWVSADDSMFGKGAGAPVEQTARGGAAEFHAHLDQFLAAAPGEITIYSGKRDPAAQLALWNRAQAGQGAPAAWSDGVSCESKHCTDEAADLAYGPGMEDWAHANAGRFGLFFPYAHEPWHIELAG